MRWKSYREKEGNPIWSLFRERIEAVGFGKSMGMEGRSKGVLIGNEGKEIMAVGLLILKEGEGISREFMGDDCPFDHELSKYPCHNYMSTGCCNRADRCKFSHKIPTTDASSQLTVSKIDLHLCSEQLKLRNQPVGIHASPLDKGSFDVKTKDTLPLRHKPLKETNQVPKGIRFISFGTVQTELSNKLKESFPVNKFCHTGAYNHEKQDNWLVHGHHSALPSKMSMNSTGLVRDVPSIGFASKVSDNITKGSPVTHTGGTANHEVSEATKILEEFLFCGVD
ncbi:Zinc finger CCCH domain-containing protein 7 [Dendrobium catenatum]|uniref:Zinc finger CCCH domain-containing protein 7 n=1 Tax=Dendrobium catenatum TaxID=906689 RepID=A0A2I0VEI5_9ASPA|nr:Zinc finger CCCH domain-containing protein 7 [Dendrobium catenatum]